MNWYKILKISQLQGEWWIQDGTAYSADSNIDDMGHEAYVIAQAQSELADEEIWDWEQWKSNKALELLQEKEEKIDQGYFEGEDEEAAKYQIWEMKQDPGYYADELIEEEIKEMGGDTDLLLVANGQGDPRLYGMKNYGWKRVEGRHVETWTLTKSDLKSIAAGLWDAYQENAEKATYNIEVRTPAKYFVNVPYQYIEDGNPARLRDYDASSGIDKGYKPKYSHEFNLNKKTASPMSGDSDLKSYMHIGHDRTYWTDDINDEEKEYIWIIDKELKIISKEIPSDIELGYSHSNFYEELSVNPNDIIFAGRCAYGPSRNVCSFRDALGAIHMQNRNKYNHRYLKLKEMAEKIIDKEFNNPEIKEMV